MPDTIAGGAGAAGPPSPTQTALDEEIFRRDLNEVHLLIEFISSLPGKSLDDLKLLDNEWRQAEHSGEQRPLMDPGEAVRRISLIRFPPDPNPSTRAEQAALLLLAKDRLNDLARPARGRSIAYTTMFAGTGAFGASRAAIARRYVAERAAPELIGHVRRFKFIWNVLLIVVFIWLLFTSLAYWDIGLGNSLLQNLAQLEQEKGTMLRANPGLLDCGSPAASAAAPSAPTGSTGNQNVPPPKIACQQLNDTLQKQGTVADELSKFQRCDGWVSSLFLRCWAGSGFVGRLSAPPTGQSQNAVLSDIPAINAVLSVFSSYILPMLFGVLGTLVATIRSIHDRIRDNLLAPRDLILTLTGLPIGAVAGLAVGLFFSLQNGTVTGLTGLPAGLSLSAAGLAFLAGYAADAFFSFVDSVRAQVFRATNPPPGSDAAATRTEPTRPVAAPPPR